MEVQPSPHAKAEPSPELEAQTPLDVKIEPSITVEVEPSTDAKKEPLHEVEVQPSLTDMSGNPCRTRLEKETMMNNVKQNRVEANPHVPKKGRVHRNPEGVDSSQEAQSQVVDPTSEYVYDIRDEGYDPIEQHYVDGTEHPYFQPPEVEDDEAEGEDQAAAHAIPVLGPPFPGGLEDLSLLSRYVNHVAVSHPKIMSTIDGSPPRPANQEQISAQEHAIDMPDSVELIRDNVQIADQALAQSQDLSREDLLEVLRQISCMG